MKFENEPTKIVYKPHCGNCGAPINDDVSYQDIYERLTESALAHRVFTEIQPYRCYCCGVPFNCIEITPPEKEHDVFLGGVNEWEL